MIKRIISSIILVIIFITGCSSQQTPKISTDSENTIAKVSKTYGETSPKIKVIETTEEKNEPAYTVTLTGNFVYGSHKSQKLKFSITKDGKKVWNLMGDGWDIPKVNIN
ncbi:hypothetical protein [Clostridium thailandense]|uniref:hypothetical protein n=1 Tax=Clostridium thailandense TaxID=2794346 RepID=UPI0039896B89